MSKNCNSTLFRSFDVDQINEEFKDEETQGDNLVGNNGGILDEQEVQNLLKSGKPAEALRLLLNAFMLSYKNQTAKEIIYNLVTQILFNVKTNEIEKIVDTFNDDELDILMKYIYRGFEHQNVGSSGHLLVWHDKVYNKGGVGSICRVLTDKKRV